MLFFHVVPICYDEWSCDEGECFSFLLPGLEQTSPVKNYNFRIARSYIQVQSS